MRVVIDARYVREKPSGIGTYVQALVERLPAEAPGDWFQFWTHPLASRPLSRSPNTSEVVVRPGPNSPLPVWWPRRYGRFDEVDLFHSPHNMMPRGLPCATVVTVHDVMALERPELHLQGLERLVKSTYYRQAVWRALRESTRIIAPTRAAADRICALEPGAAARVHVIYEAAAPCFRPAQGEEPLRRSVLALTGAGAPYVLVVGANSATKRHADAVAAFAAGVPVPWRLVLVQRRGSQRGLANLAERLGIADRVVWIAGITRDDLITLMQAADVLVQPSLYEGFGLPVIEAMACGCPVVASDIPVFREITAGAAALAEPQHVEHLAEALRMVLTSPTRRREMAAAGLARAGQFSWDRCASETLEVYHEAGRCRPRRTDQAFRSARTT
jgi:glycosyltransferase involved in cell wall biosynthesis